MIFTQHMPLFARFSQPKHKVRPKGFTLIELMIVITIVIILLAILLIGGAEWRKHAKITQTQMMLDALNAVVVEYHVETQRYPTATTIQAFLEEVEDVGDIPKMLGSFWQVDPDTNDWTQINDPWDREILVEFVGGSVRPRFRSRGPDPVDTDDDIVSGGGT